MCVQGPRFRGDGDQVSPPPPPFPSFMCHLPRLQSRLFSRPAGSSPSGYPILGYCLVGRSAGPVEKSIYSAEYQRLCAVLRELRQEAGLTQVQVATRLDMPQSFVSKYESGERRLDVVELGHVAGALGVTVQRVLERMEG
jgi:DNA-binding XRE family transcriptional regulator